MSVAEKRLFDKSCMKMQREYDRSLLYRNNSGALPDRTGQLVRFGIGNDSAQLNKVWKSPDSIGGTRITITPDMVGRTVCVLTGFEFKRPGWKLTPGDKHAQAQYACIMDWRDAGGIAGFVTDPEHVDYYIREFINGKG